MGMFDKDKLFAPDGPMKDWASDNTPFILWDIEYRGEVPTPDGPTDTAPIVWLTVSTPESPNSKDVVSLLGDNIKEKAESKQDGDLPAMCVMKHVDSSYGDGAQKAYVLNFHGDYLPGEGKAKEKAAK